MNGFLLDTNTISELVSVKPNPRLLEWLDSMDENLLYLSVITLGEIRQGTAALPHSKKRTRLEAWLEVELQTRFFGRILPVDESVADRWGVILAQPRVKGAPLPVVDGLLAAAALHHNLTIVTRNTGDFPVSVSTSSIPGSKPARPEAPPSSGVP